MLGTDLSRLFLFVCWSVRRSAPSFKSSWDHDLTKPTTAADGTSTQAAAATSELRYCPAAEMVANKPTMTVPLRPRPPIPQRPHDARYDSTLTLSPMMTTELLWRKEAQAAAERTHMIFDLSLRVTSGGIPS